MPPKPAPIAAAMPAMVAPTPAPPTPATAMPSSSNNSVDARLDALSAHVEDLQKSLAQATQQLSQVSATLTANTASPTVSSSAVDDRLNKIEQKLMQIQHETVSPPPAMTADTSSGMRSEKTIVKTHRHNAAHKKMASVKMRKPKKTANRIVEAEREKPLTTTHWVLRAATPDEAWVARDANSPELRHVRVGDNLSGIGTVLGIHQDGNNWVVEGSQGSLQ
jgi:hypothetical protein